MITSAIDFAYRVYQTCKNLTTLFYLNKINYLSDISFILQLDYYNEALDYVKKGQVSIAEYINLLPETKIALSNRDIKNFILAGHISIEEYNELSNEIKFLLAYSDRIRSLIINDSTNLEKIKKLNLWQIAGLFDVYISLYFSPPNPITLEQYAQLSNCAIQGLKSMPISRLFQYDILNITQYIKFKNYHINALEQQFDNDTIGNIFKLLHEKNISVNTFYKLSETKVDGLNNQYIFELIKNGSINSNKYIKLCRVNVMILIDNAEEIYLKKIPISDIIRNKKEIYKKDFPLHNTDLISNNHDSSDRQMVIDKKIKLKMRA